MLLITHSLKEINFRALTNLYRESIQLNAQEQYPEEASGYGILLAEGNFYDYLKSDFFRVQGALYALWAEQGNYLSGLRLEPYRDGLLLTGLETAPDHRRRGYGSQLMQTVLERYGEHPIYSHVHKQNAASLQLHTKCGFQRISEQAIYLDGSANSRCCTLKFWH